MMRSGKYIRLALAAGGALIIAVALAACALDESGGAGNSGAESADAGASADAGGIADAGASAMPPATGDAAGNAAERTVLDYIGDEVDVKESRELARYSFDGMDYSEWYVRFRGKTADALGDSDAVLTLGRTGTSVWVIIDNMHYEQYGTPGDYPSFIEAATAVASAYYDGGVLSCQPIFDQEVYAGFYQKKINPEQVRGALFAFYIQLTDTPLASEAFGTPDGLPGAAPETPVTPEAPSRRVIILTKPQGGEWEIIYAGEAEEEAGERDGR
ncbi:MAG: hypothetical protein LBK98_00110 [Peptococcaceae bacterium]|jgi:hypothetical protein|nr:hypothetical protein [Peptococcaceae bacterium]